MRLSSTGLFALHTVNNGLMQQVAGIEPCGMVFVALVFYPADREDTT